MEMSGLLHALAALPPGMKHSTNQKGGVDNRAGLDNLEMRKLSCPYWHLNPGPLSPLTIMYNYTKYLPQMMQNS